MKTKNKNMVNAYTVGEVNSYDKYLLTPGPHTKIGRRCSSSGPSEEGVGWKVIGLYVGGIVFETLDDAEKCAEEYGKKDGGKYGAYGLILPDGWTADVYIPVSLVGDRFPYRLLHDAEIVAVE